MALPTTATARDSGKEKKLALMTKLPYEQTMNIANQPFGLPDDAPELARRFAAIMAGLGAVIARRFLKMPHLVGFTLLLYNRLNQAVRRLHRALANPAKAGAPRPRADRKVRDRARPIALPSRRGWILRELGWEVALYMSLLENLLREVETQAALAASPGVGRILRPICRMLGVSAEVVPKILPKAAAVMRSPMPHPTVGAARIPALGTETCSPERGQIFSSV